MCRNKAGGSSFHEPAHDVCSKILAFERCFTCLQTYELMGGCQQRRHLGTPTRYAYAHLPVLLCWPRLRPVRGGGDCASTVATPAPLRPRKRAAVRWGRGPVGTVTRALCVSARLSRRAARRGIGAASLIRPAAQYPHRPIGAHSLPIPWAPHSSDR